MVSIGRGQENAPDRLRLFRVDGSGVAENPTGVRFRIFDDTGVSPSQVFPISGYEDATSAPARFDTGAFYAYDGTAGKGWTPADDAPLGDWYIEWDVDLGGGYSLVKTEAFQVVESAAHASDPLYVGVSDLRAEGMPNPPLASTLEKNIRTWQAFVIRACRQWFHPAHMVFRVDGTDSDALHFGVPIVSIDELRINNESTALDAQYYEVYADSGRYPDNRANPRIKLVDEWLERRDIFTASLGPSRNFRKGRQNQYISGVFGCVEVDGSVPLLIQRALLKLVVEKTATPVYAGVPGVTPPAAVSGLIVEEWTDGHKIKYDSSSTSTNPRAPGLSGITGDREILDILRMYRAPIGIATPADPSAVRG